MNREELIDIFDGRRPADDADWQAVADLIESEPELEATLGDETDAVIADAMVDVEVPAHLQASLKTALGLEAPQTTPASKRRANWLRGTIAATATAAVVILAVVFWPNETPTPEKPSFVDLRGDVLTTPWDDLPEFDGSFQPKQNEELRSWQLSKLNLERQPRGYSKSGSHIAAVYRFRLPRQAGKPSTGYLLIIPRHKLGDLPDRNEFSSRNPTYLSRPAGMVSTAWKDKDFVYVCAIEHTPGGGDPLEKLQAILAGQPV